MPLTIRKRDWERREKKGMPVYQWHHIVQFIFCSFKSPKWVFLVIKALVCVILIQRLKSFMRFKRWYCGSKRDDWKDHLGFLSFPGGSDGKESTCNAGDLGSIPGLGRSPGEGNGCSFQYSCLENSMDRGAWQARQLSLSNGMVPKIDHFWWHNHRMTAKASCWSRMEMKVRRNE